ncbi:zinc finger protein 664-like [Spodoptera litura]|uniref:Zinc finger protein 664-like n=1 Tax=Spodoptera litura TaxID=69820 RepID=A0A9J7EEP6_SPOLT|nr:zinc finger protein 664-like [Spodoptera litura]
MDTSNLCRSCMKEVTSWEKENFDPRVVDMFCFCTNIAISEEDKLPKQFCYDCAIKIESAFTYITEAHKVDATLKNIISRTNTSIIVEPETQSRHIDSLKLTLPDYKISTTIDSYDEHILFDNIELAASDSQIIPEKTLEEIESIQNIPEEVENAEKNNPESVKEKVNANETKKNICPICRKGFTSKTWFNKHMKKEHTENKFVCPQCPKTFSKASLLSDHTASHSDERKFACTTCGKRFKRRKQLACHARAHADIRPYACDKCSMRFKIKSILKSHMKVHDGDKQYLCYFCGWSFAQAGNLEVHMRKHTGEKPFCCNECGFRAAVSSNLRRHQRQHQAAKTYVCKHCNKGFYDASGLARHLRTHTGELPYQCPGCARAFADSWKRKTHLMRAHRLALPDIPRMRRDGRTIN